MIKKKLHYVEEGTNRPICNPSAYESFNWDLIKDWNKVTCKSCLKYSKKAILICKKIELMVIKPHSKAFCLECRAIVGITKSSEEAFAQEKNKDYLCIECFKKKTINKEDEFMPITEKQKEELVNYFKNL